MLSLMILANLNIHISSALSVLGTTRIVTHATGIEANSNLLYRVSVESGICKILLDHGPELLLIKLIEVDV